MQTISLEDHLEAINKKKFILKITKLVLNSLMVCSVNVDQIAV